MIDPVLSQLTDDLKAAEATLNSPDFGSKQARLVALEQEARDTIARIDAERETLAASLEGDEAAYENAQNALTAYIAANYLEGVNVGDDDMFDPEPPFVPPVGSGPEGSAMPFAILDDEYASAKSNGALTD
jgi:multidrug efflux pump subunit AcrA (membrane-fusion protein)